MYCLVQYLTSNKCSMHVSKTSYLNKTALVGRNGVVKLEVQLGRTEASGPRQGAQEQAGLGRGIFSLKFKISHHNGNNQHT